VTVSSGVSTTGSVGAGEGASVASGVAVGSTVGVAVTGDSVGHGTQVGIGVGVSGQVGIGLGVLVGHGGQVGDGGQVGIGVGVAGQVGEGSGVSVGGGDGGQPPPPQMEIRMSSKVRRDASNNMMVLILLSLSGSTLRSMYHSTSQPRINPRNKVTRATMSVSNMSNLLSELQGKAADKSLSSHLSNPELPVTGRRSMTTVKVTSAEGSLVLPASSLATAITVCSPGSRGSSATKAQSP